MGTILLMRRLYGQLSQPMQSISWLLDQMASSTNLSSTAMVETIQLQTAVFIGRIPVSSAHGRPYLLKAAGINNGFKWVVQHFQQEFPLPSLILSILPDQAR